MSRMNQAIPVYDTDTLDDIDLDSAFVTVDSNRINLTFRHIFKLLRAIGPNMANFEKLLASQGAEITKVANDTSKLEGKMLDMDDKVGGHDLKLQKLAEVQHTHTTRLDALEKRIAAQERQNADLRDLGETLSKLRADIRQLQTESDSLNNTMQRHTSAIDGHTVDIKSLNDGLGKERDRITAIYNVFEMDEKKVLHANAHGNAAAASSNNAANGRRVSAAGAAGGAVSTPTSANLPAAGSAVEAVMASKAPQPVSPASSSGGNRQLSAQCQYLFTLPAFTELRHDFNANIGAAEQRMAAELEKAVAKLNGDLSNLRGKLADKVDIRDYKPFEMEVKEALKRLHALFANYDKLVIELQNKADKSDTEKRLQHLQATKADRSELLNMVTMDDIRALDKKIQDLSDAFDALLGKVNLDLNNLRNMRNVPVASTNSGDGMDPTLPGRVAKLETETRDLYAIKADKFQLQELLRSMDKSGTAAAVLPQPPAPTPPQPLSARSATPPPQKQPSRPSSATSGSRAPHSPLVYTSTSPTRNPPIFNKGRFSASAVLYDCDGNRTPASVTAARAVGNVQHLHNVARHVANPSGDIPDDHKVHVLP